MIRREWPLGATNPSQWLLIGQIEHARLSWELAKAWGGPSCFPVVCPPEDGHPLQGVREEFLTAMREHDAGWIGYPDDPEIDAERERPLNFTEMPPSRAQAIWRDSIDACRQIGPLAGWVVASHFTALQSKQDDDFHQWLPWIEEISSLKAEWLEEWLAQDTLHTRELADRCLGWLQSFDWISLWLCCACPLTDRDAKGAPLEIARDELGVNGVVFESIRSDESSNGREVRVTPWPFVPESLRLRVPARLIPAKGACPDGLGAEEAITALWALKPGD